MATPEQLKKALERWRNRSFAEFTCICVALAAEEYPQEMRTALAGVFDVRCLEDQLERIRQAGVIGQQAAQDAKALLQQVHLDIEDVEKQIDALRYVVEQLSKKVHDEATSRLESNVSP